MQNQEKALFFFSLNRSSTFQRLFDVSCVLSVTFFDSFVVTAILFVDVIDRCFWIENTTTMVFFAFFNAKQETKNSARLLNVHTIPAYSFS